MHEPRATRGVYRGWIIANTWSELIGLGGSMFLGYLLFSRLDDSEPVVVVAGALFAIVAGALLEGTLVGYAQSRVLAGSALRVSSSAWIRATTVGAAIAWTLGMIPSTAAALLASASVESAPVQEPSTFVVVLIALGMGLVLGPVLGVPQALVLRGVVSRPQRWVFANALAWAFGMAVVFAGSGLVPVGASLGFTAATLVLTCTAAGAVVGAVHGVWIRRFLAEAEV